MVFGHRRPREWSKPHKLPNWFFFFPISHEHEYNYDHFVPISDSQVVLSFSRVETVDSTALYQFEELLQTWRKDRGLKILAAQATGEVLDVLEEHLSKYFDQPRMLLTLEEALFQARFQVRHAARDSGGELLGGGAMGAMGGLGGGGGLVGGVLGGGLLPRVVEEGGCGGASGASRVAGTIVQPVQGGSG